MSLLPAIQASLITLVGVDSPAEKRRSAVKAVQGNQPSIANFVLRAIRVARILYRKFAQLDSECPMSATDAIH